MSTLDVFRPALFLPTTASPTLRGALKDGLGEAVVACDMPEPCEFPDLDSYRKRFLRTHEGVDVAHHPVAGPVLQEGDAENIPNAFGLEGLDPTLTDTAQPQFYSDQLSTIVLQHNPHSPLTNTALPFFSKKNILR